MSFYNEVKYLDILTLQQNTNYGAKKRTTDLPTPVGSLISLQLSGIWDVTLR